MLARSSIVLATLALVSAVGSSASAQDLPPISQYKTWVTSLAYSKDGNVLATAGGQTLLYRPGDVRLWDPNNGQQKASLEGHPTTVWAAAITPDGQTLATGGYDGPVEMGDLAHD